MVQTSFAGHFALCELSLGLTGDVGGLATEEADETGLTGRYDFTIDLSNVLDPSTPMGINDVIPIFVQVAQQQLGIKIDEKKVAVEMLMVDHAEKIPVEN